MTKYNRRDFIKQTLVGIFGAFLTWAGVVRAKEEAIPVQVPSVWTETPELASTTTTSGQNFVPITHWGIDAEGLVWLSYDGGITYLVGRQEGLEDDDFYIDGRRVSEAEYTRALRPDMISWHDISPWNPDAWVVSLDDLPDDPSTIEGWYQDDGSIRVDGRDTVSGPIEAIGQWKHFPVGSDSVIEDLPGFTTTVVQDQHGKVIDAGVLPDCPIEVYVGRGQCTSAEEPIFGIVERVNEDGSVEVRIGSTRDPS